jgi:hypothetical protein
MVALLFSLSSVAQTTVAAGDVVQEDGIFLTNTEAAKILAAKEIQQERCLLKKETAIAHEQSRCVLRSGNLEAKLDSVKHEYEVVTKLKDKEIENLYEQVENQGDYDGYFFAGGIALGTIVTAVSLMAVFFASVQIVKTDSLVESK